MNLKIKNALVSVSDKENIISLLKIFKKYKIKIISSGGTNKFIKNLGYDCTELSKYTGFKEMLDGRVKTLHPKIHAWILHDRQNKDHKNQLSEKKFPPIDLIVVNFYPFQKVVMETRNTENIIENIDIGGPTMVRAAAKNFKNVAIITNKNDYEQLIKELEKKPRDKKFTIWPIIYPTSCISFRRNLMIKFTEQRAKNITQLQIK